MPELMTPPAQQAASMAPAITPTAAAALAPREDYTFGIEIECGIPASAVAANNIVRGDYHRGTQVPGLPRGWTCQGDGSVDVPGTMSCEIVSPILVGAAGLREALLVVAILKGWGARVNATCGFHVHVGCTDAETIRRLVCLCSNYQLGLFASTGTKRREAGTFCKPVRESFRNLDMKGKARIADWGRPVGDRYHMLNLARVSAGGKTVEFRLFGGTLNPVKVAAYVRLAIGLVERAATAKIPVPWVSRLRAPTDTGAEEVERMMMMLCWLRAKNRRAPVGLLFGDGIPPLQSTVATLRRLARKYDGYTVAPGEDRRMADTADD